jgi:hypothetical protein
MQEQQMDIQKQKQQDRRLSHEQYQGEERRKRDQPAETPAGDPPSEQPGRS